MSTPPLSPRNFLPESLKLDFTAPSSPEAIRSARSIFKDLCNRFRSNNLAQKLQVRSHAHLLDASKFLHALLDHSPDENSEDSILRVLLYNSFAAADSVAFPLPVKPSAASKTLDDILDDIRRNSLALDDAVVIRLYDMAFDLLNSFIVQCKHHILSLASRCHDVDAN